MSMLVFSSTTESIKKKWKHVLGDHDENEQQDKESPVKMSYGDKGLNDNVV
jgi:hypothetical protein